LVLNSTCQKLVPVRQSFQMGLHDDTSGHRRGERIIVAGRKKKEREKETNKAVEKEGSL